MRKKCTKKPRFIKFVLLSTVLTIPSILLGFMLEKLLLSVLGTALTFIACSVVIVAFTLLLYVGFNLFDVSIVLKRIKRKTAKPL